MQNVANSLKNIGEKIEQAALKNGRTADSVRLIAVTKRISAELILQAMRHGQILFGESYVQEARKKLRLISQADASSGRESGIELDSDFSDLSPTDLGIEMHLIGGLQKNKVKHAVGFFNLIHSVDRLELAQAIDLEAGKRDIVQDLLLQINISSEATKSGVVPKMARKLLEQTLGLDNVKVSGLMSIGTWHAPDVSREVRCAEFAQLAELRYELSGQTGLELPELSMGMSDDFELAIEHGATLVRVGTALFGERSGTI